MNVQIRPLQTGDIEEVLQLSLLAWAPVFRSFEHVLGPAIYTKIYPDWETSQRAVVDEVLRDGEKYTVWVADQERTIVGFIAYTLSLAERVGEVYLLAVHPAYQNRGIGTDLNNFALGQFKDRGMQLAVVGTGGDPGHAPARRSYEKAGYTPLPLVRYYKDL
jgi:GNAT superfamily N-acetyltransferase